ncbi:MAG: hypothetical protein Q8P89_00715 [bacterium]|nr:hypothetical protein [bacterium]
MGAKRMIDLLLAFWEFGWAGIYDCHCEQKYHKSEYGSKESALFRQTNYVLSKSAQKHNGRTD